MPEPSNHNFSVEHPLPPRQADTGGTEITKLTRAEEWLAENREALDSFNAYIEQHGLPLEKYRSF